MKASTNCHLERQFDTTTSTHMLRHDIHFFGVVLFDLDLWDDQDLSWKSTMKTRPVNNDEASVVYRRPRSFTGRMDFYIGNCYPEAVKNCLDDGCFERVSNRETPGIFIDSVLDKIHDMLGFRCTAWWVKYSKEINNLKSPPNGNGV